MSWGCDKKKKIKLERNEIKDENWKIGIKFKNRFKVNNKRIELRNMILDKHWKLKSNINSEYVCVCVWPDFESALEYWTNVNIKDN